MPPDSTDRVVISPLLQDIKVHKYNMKSNFELEAYFTDLQQILDDIRKMISPITKYILSKINNF